MIFNQIRFSVNKKNFEPKCSKCGLKSRQTVRVHPKAGTAYQANVYTHCECGNEENYVIDKDLNRVGL